MQKEQLVDIHRIDPKEVLKTYCNTHYRRSQTSKSPVDVFRQTIIITDETLREDHNCLPYLVTVTFPKTPDINTEWVLAGKWVDEFKRNISKIFFVVGGIVVAEPHKNSTLYQKKGKNTKAARPHFHMILWIAHPELSPSINLLKRIFLQNRTLAKVNLLPTGEDLLRAALYIVKERGNESLNYMCQQFLRWETSVNLWVNQHEAAPLFQEVFESFKEQEAFMTHEEFMQFPTARNHRDKALLLVEIYTKVFTKNGWAVRGEALYKRIEGTHYSWKYSMPLEQWIASTFKLTMPTTYLEILKENALWITRMGRTKKMAPRFELFPTLKLMLFIIEFKDCIYELEGATRMPFQSVAPQTSSVCFADTTFDQCQPPYTLLGLLYTAINWGREEGVEIIRLESAQQEARGNQERRIVPTNLPSPDKEMQTQIDCMNAQIERIPEIDSRFIEALQTFGGLYHPEINRKLNPALYIQGQPSAYKTSILLIVLSQLVGKENIDVISRYKSKFNLAHLRKPDQSPFLLIFDDHRWEQMGILPADLMNLLDGKVVHTEEKFGKGQGGELAGSLAFTSNESIFDGIHDLDTATAMQTRVKEVTFWKPNSQYYPIPNTKEFFQQLESEAVAFSILSNAVFLASRQRVNLQHSLPKSFFAVQQGTYTFHHERLAYAGQRHLRIVLKHLQQKQEQLFT